MTHYDVAQLCNLLNFISFFASKEFVGNSDKETVVRHDLEKAIVTRFIRIHPTRSRHHISLRAEFYGCQGMIFLLG